MLPAMLSQRLAQGYPYPFEVIAQWDGTDFTHASDRDLEQILWTIRSWDLPGASDRLCDVQREWLIRRFDNWMTNTPDTRLERLNGGARTKEDERSAKSYMGTVIGATPRAVGRHAEEEGRQQQPVWHLRQRAQRCLRCRRSVWTCRPACARAHSAPPASNAFAHWRRALCFLLLTASVVPRCCASCAHMA